jgi:hypothetical protein
MNISTVIVLVILFISTGLLALSIGLFIGSYFTNKINRKKAGLLVIAAIIISSVYAQFICGYDFIK